MYIVKSRKSKENKGVARPKIREGENFLKFLAKAIEIITAA